MRRTGLAPLVLAFLLLSAEALSAQQQVASPYRWLTRTQGAGPFVGYLFTTSSLTLNRRDDQEESAEFGPQSAPVVGIRYNGRLTGPLDGEVSVGFAPSERRLLITGFSPDSTRVNPVDTGETIGMPLVMGEVGLRLNLTGARTWRGLQPYVAATGGVVAALDGSSDAEEELENEDRFDFGPTVAVGLKAGTAWYPSERFSVNLELSDRLWKLTSPVGFRVRAGAVESEWKNNYGVTIGGAFHF